MKNGKENLGTIRDVDLTNQRTTGDYGDYSGTFGDVEFIKWLGVTSRK